MEKDIAISVIDLHKAFKVPHDRDSSLKSAVLNMFKKKKYSEMVAADGINFSVKRGEFLGIIGRNGSGKSTMLKMLAGIYLPDSGKIKVNGRLSPFLEVGVGFNPELSGRDNVYLSGTILGLTKEEIDGKFDDIVDFAEMHEFIDQKVKNYSSGMQVRLAFSVALQAHSDIMLIDEVLAVGDSNFQAKCNRVFHRLKKEGRTIVFVTHSMPAVSEYCDRVILLKDGKIFKEGNSKEVITEYEKLNFDSKEGPGLDTANWGSMLATVKGVTYSQQGKSGIGVTQHNKPFEIIFEIFNNSSENILANLAVEIFKMDGTKCFGTITSVGGKGAIELLPGKSKLVSLDILKNTLLPGEYYIDFRLYGGNNLEDIIHASSYVSKFIVQGATEVSGIVDLGHLWKL